MDITALLLAVCAVRVVVSVVFTFVSCVQFCIGMIARLPKKNHLTDALGDHPIIQHTELDL